MPSNTFTVMAILATVSAWSCSGGTPPPPEVPPQQQTKPEVWEYFDPCGDAQNCTVTGLSVSPDGERVLVQLEVSGAPQAFVLDAALESALTTPLPAQFAALSPDGRWLAVVAPDSDGVDVYDLHDMAAGPMRVADGVASVAFAPDSTRIMAVTHDGSELTEIEIGSGTRTSWGPVPAGASLLGWGPSGVQLASPGWVGLVREAGSPLLVRIEFTERPAWIAATPGRAEALYQLGGFDYLLLDGEASDAETLVGLVYKPDEPARPIRTPDRLSDTPRALTLVRLADGDVAQLSVDESGRAIIANRLVFRR